MPPPACTLRLAAQRCTQHQSLTLTNSQIRHASTKPRKTFNTSRRPPARRGTVRATTTPRSVQAISRPVSEWPAENVSHIQKTFAAAYDLPEGSAENLSMAQIERSLASRGGRTKIARPVRPKKGGFMSMGVKPGPNNEGMEEDEEYDYNDITALAHGDLEQHRELRHYARLAAWEMPLLTKMAKEFQPPTHKEILRFRKTSYMGEQHPAQHKCVVEFCPSDIPNLTPLQLSKLQKLLGARYTPLPATKLHPANWASGIAKMSCEKYPTWAENAADLRLRIDNLVTAAMDDTDTFEDIPLDKRHYKEVSKPRFPVEWRIDIKGERMLEIEGIRAKALQLDEGKVRSGQLIDGTTVVQEAIANMALLGAGQEEELVPVRVGGGARKAQGRKVSVRR